MMQGMGEDMGRIITGMIIVLIVGFFLLLFSMGSCTYLACTRNPSPVVLPDNSVSDTNHVAPS